MINYIQVALMTNKYNPTKRMLRKNGQLPKYFPTGKKRFS
jgi:hypothetical protein